MKVIKIIWGIGACILLLELSYLSYKIIHRNQDVAMDKIEESVKIALIEKVGKPTLWATSDTIYAEAHEIFKTERKDNHIYVYGMALIETYIKNNGEYTSTSGMAGPIVLIFDKQYQFLEYKVPEDRKDYENSLKKIFPEEYINQALSTDYKSITYQKQIQKYLP